jgi:hypothetical protein
MKRPRFIPLLFKNFLLILLFLASSQSLPALAASSNSASPLGTNIASMLYFDKTDWLLVDQFARTSEWHTYSASGGGWDCGVITSTDANGWPTGVDGDTILLIEMLSGTYGAYPAGTYILYWEGSGATFAVGNEASNLRCEDGKPVTNCPGRKALFDVTTPGDSGISIEINPDSPETYSPSNYIRNIRVIMPGGVCGRSLTDLDYDQYCATSRGGTGTCDDGETAYDFDLVHWNRFSDPVSEMNNTKVVFHPKSLQLLQPFRVLRFMNLMRTNYTTVENWSDRATVTYYSQGLNKGCAYEYLNALANYFGASPWFNMPHGATDDYISQFANFAKTNLDPVRKIYLEYSNEPLTTEFSQHAYFLGKANELGIGEGESDNNKVSKYFAKRLVEIRDIWHSVFSDDTARIYTILTGFIGNAGYSSLMLQYENTATKVNALSIAPYFAGYIGQEQYEATVEGWGLTQLFSEINNGGLDGDAPTGAMDQIYKCIDDHVTVLQSYPTIDLVAYEGGQHLRPLGQVEQNETILNLFKNANRDDRIKPLYADLLDYWRSKQGVLFVNFQHVEPYRFGAFSAIESLLNATRANYPKYDALLTFHDNAQPGTLQFSSSTYSATESDATVTITVTRQGGSDGAVRVCYRTSDGTATAGTDYTAAEGRLMWNNVETASKTFTVSIADDLIKEDNETIQINLRYPEGGASIGAIGSTTLTIIDAVSSARYVSRDGYCGGKTPCHSTMQAAIEAARTGSVILIADGTYDEDVTLDVDKSLTLQGGWDSSFGNPTGTTTLRNAPRAPRGSLTLQMVTIEP